HARADEDEGAGGAVHTRTVEFEPGLAALDEVELLVLPFLVVLVDDPVPRLLPRPGVDPQRGDAGVVAHPAPRGAALADLADLLQSGNCVLAHRRSSVSCDIAREVCRDGPGGSGI